MADYKKLLSFLKVDSIFDDLIAIVEAKVELLNITIATLLNYLLESHFWGYAIVTGFYSLLLIGFKVFKVGKKLEVIIEASLNNLNSESNDEIEEVDEVDNE